VAIAAIAARTSLAVLTSEGSVRLAGLVRSAHRLAVRFQATWLASSAGASLRITTAYATPPLLSLLHPDHREVSPIEVEQPRGPQQAISTTGLVGLPVLVEGDVEVCRPRWPAWIEPARQAAARLSSAMADRVSVVTDRLDGLTNKMSGATGKDGQEHGLGRSPALVRDCVDDIREAARGGTL
jgi:hypothetical protein